MNRGKPLRRRTRLRPGRPLQRRTPLRSTSRPQAGGTGPDRTTRELVLERDDYRCVVCGEPIFGRRYSLHHRRNRGSGGSSSPQINAPTNLLTVCGDGVQGCHGHLGGHPAEAIARGYSVSLNSTQDPADVPVDHAVHGTIRLLLDGTWRPARAIPEGREAS